jgi:hypothetical protein
MMPMKFEVAMPSYCRVDGIVDPRKGLNDVAYGIGFALALPENWNGRFLLQGGAATLDNFDMLGAITDWVEKGIAPEDVVATGRSLPGRRRPLCQLVCVGCNVPKATGPLVAPAGKKDTKGSATVQFFDGPHDPLAFFGPIKVLDAKMSIMEGSMPGGGLGLGEVLSQWEE